jgi:hypothetical protein
MLPLTQLQHYYPKHCMQLGGVPLVCNDTVLAPPTVTTLINGSVIAATKKSAAIPFGANNLFKPIVAGLKSVLLLGNTYDSGIDFNNISSKSDTGRSVPVSSPRMLLFCTKPSPPKIQEEELKLKGPSQSDSVAGSDLLSETILQRFPLNPSNLRVLRTTKEK